MEGVVMAQAGEWVGSRRRSRAGCRAPRAAQQHPEQHRQGEVHLGGEAQEVWVGHHGTGGAEQFEQADQGKQRGVLQQGDELPHRGRQGDTQGLGQHHLL